MTTAPGAIAILVFSNGATVNVAEDSTLDIVDQFEQDPFAQDLKISDMKHEEGTSTTKLSLARGELVGKVVHLNVDKGSEFTVQTPVGAAGIRGTTFRIVFKPAKNGKVFFVVTTTEERRRLQGQRQPPSAFLRARRSSRPSRLYGTHGHWNRRATTVPTVDLVTSDIPPAEAAAIVTTTLNIEQANQDDPDTSLDAAADASGDAARTAFDDAVAAGSGPGRHHERRGFVLIPKSAFIGA